MQQRTYQTRLSGDPARDAVLLAYAERAGRAERTLFARLQAGEPLAPLKRAFLVRFGLTARQFNALAASVYGKIASVRQRRLRLIGSLERRIARAQQVLAQTQRERARATRSAAGWPDYSSAWPPHPPSRRQAACGCALGRGRCSASSSRSPPMGMHRTRIGCGTGAPRGRRSSSCSARRTKLRAARAVSPRCRVMGPSRSGCACPTRWPPPASTWCCPACASATERTPCAPRRPEPVDDES